MTDQIRICNNALSDIGLQPILNINEASTRANVLRDKYPSGLKAVLELDIPWNFATFYGTLPKSAVCSSWAYTYQYPLRIQPYCLRILDVEGDVDHEIGADPTDGRVVWANGGPPLKIRYIGLVEDTGRWNELAVKCLQKWLAAELSQLSSAPGRNKETLLKELSSLIPAAEARDAREGKPKALTPNNTLVLARQTTGHMSRRW